MKRILVIFMCLLTVFFTSWSVKAKTPINRPSNLEEEETTPWYEQTSATPTASDEWYVDPEIPLNYIPVPGEDELYMVVDDSGNITGYRHRTQQEDGTWVWEDVNPDIPDNYEAVAGLENVYKVTAEDGTVSYVIYVRNDDDTYCFVPCDENGVPLDNGADAETIDSNYVHVDGNVYAMYNDDGVLMGYRERVQDSGGDYTWIVCDAPETSGTVGNGLGSIGTSSSSSSSGTTIYTEANSSSGTTTTTNSDGSYTEKETTVYTSEESGYTVTYQTVVYKTYDSSGTLLSTKKEGPYEVSREKSTTATADKSQIASSLDAELARVSASVTFDTEKANEVLSKLNAERASQGVATLTMDTSSDAYKIACLRAADMAIYNYSSTSSDMYGTLEEMLALFGVSSSSPSENIWKATEKTAAEIHTRFQANEGSRTVRMSSSYTSVGIAIVEANGNTYIAEVYLE